MFQQGRSGTSGNNHFARCGHDLGLFRSDQREFAGAQLHAGNDLSRRVVTYNHNCSFTRAIAEDGVEWMGPPIHEHIRADIAAFSVSTNVSSRQEMRYSPWFSHNNVRLCSISKYFLATNATPV